LQQREAYLLPIDAGAALRKEDRMPKNAVSYTKLTHQVVQGAPEPLPVEEILARVADIAPITTSNPKQTIRNAISSSRLIVSVGDKRYGWMPRVLNNSVLRLTLTADDLGNKWLVYSDEVRDALYPAFYESGKRSDRAPITLVLPDGSTAQVALEHGGNGQWGTPWTVGLWRWLTAQGAQAGDHLIVTVLDGEARRYGLAFQPRSERDETAIAQRNHETIAALLPYANKSRGASIWEMTGALLAKGHYQHPVPPDPLSDIVASQAWRAAMNELGLINGWNPMGLGGFSDLLDTINNGFALDTAPADLPFEYQPGPDRRPRAMVSQSKPSTTYVLRVTHRYVPGVWRDIEIAAEQTLEDLHLAIQEAYRWDDDHLYSFYLNGQAWDGRSEIGSPWSDSPRHTHQVTVRSLNLKPKRKILYLFDYGDNHEFDVEVLAINDQSATGTYPKIVGRKGRAPRQYTEW